MNRPAWLRNCKMPLQQGETLDELGRVSQLYLCSTKRPWYRAFHLSWVSFFTAFLAWFSITPLLNHIREDLDLTRNDVDLSNLASIAACVVVRFSLGPLCERYGPSRPQSLLLFFGATPLLLTGLVANSGTSLVVLRFFVGILGGAFVPCQFWTSVMFSPRVVGTANALAGGWGNLGGGVSMLLMTGLASLAVKLGFSASASWRIALTIPALLCFAVAVAILLLGDDCPQGDWEARVYGSTMKRRGSDLDLTRRGSGAAPHQPNPYLDYRVFLVGFQYACCFGVELAVTGILPLYLYDEFLETCGDAQCRVNTKEGAALLSSVFGLTNVFARFLGGALSDQIEAKTEAIAPHLGRQIVQFGLLLFEGLFLLGLSYTTDPHVSIGMLVAFSIFVQASEGSTFATVPALCPTSIAVASGIVGACGNLGGLAWGELFRRSGTYREGMWYLSFVVLVSSALTATIPMGRPGSRLLCPRKKEASESYTVTPVSEDYRV